MTDDPRKRADTDIEDADRENAEQDETGTQAQDIASEALSEPYRGRDSLDSEHGGHSDPTQLIPDDVQDVVDHMNDMDRSGRIDMDAFEGEDNMDDEDGSLPD